MFTKRIVPIALALGLAVVAAPALARKGGKGGGDAAAAFPMQAAEFKQKVDARIEKKRARMEEHLKDADAAKAKEAREKFAANAAKLKAEVDKVAADGVVTKDEAKQVHDVAKAMHPHKGKKDHQKKALPRGARSLLVGWERLASCRVSIGLRPPTSDLRGRAEAEAAPLCHPSPCERISRWVCAKRLVFSETPQRNGTRQATRHPGGQLAKRAGGRRPSASLLRRPAGLLPAEDAGR
jgi:hypothetical protein